MNPDVTPYGMLLDVNLLQKKKEKKRCNKHLILMRLLAYLPFLCAL
jgi:hypothetical protein